MKITEKYEYNGWPSVNRPDVKPPAGWSMELITAVSRIRHHTLSPDGQRIAFIWDRDEASDIYMMSVSGGWAQRVSFERKLVAYWSDELPAWSPDGQRLAFGMNGHVYVMPVEGKLPKKISDFTEGASSPVWMPDSQGLLVSADRGDSTHLLLSDADGAWPRSLVSRADGDVWDAQPSPDGRFVAYTFRPFDDLNRLDIHLVEVATGQVRELLGSPKVRRRAARWSPDGSWLVFISEESGWNELWRVKPDGDGLHQLTHFGHDVEDAVWSPDGTQLAAILNRSGACHLALIDPQTGAASDLRTDEGFYSRPNWSPSGDWLTVEYESPTQPPDIYKVEMNGRVTPLTTSQLPALAAQPLVQPERVSYKSFDGLEIPAFLYRPAKPNGAAVLYPHGGPSAQYVLEWDILAQYFVAKGYTWIAPNYRGSTGYGLEFEHANYNDWGKGDLQDCLHGAKFLRDLPEVDASRIASYGGSYGGYMTACALSRDPDYLFACGVDKYGDANLISSWAQCNRHLRLYSEIFLGHPSQNRQIYLDGSPIHQVENVQKPVLILHGLLDDVVPPEASEEWVHALRKAGKTFEYKTYADEPHGFLQRSTQLDAWQRIERFLDWYLLP